MGKTTGDEDSIELAAGPDQEVAPEVAKTDAAPAESAELAAAPQSPEPAPAAEPVPAAEPAPAAEVAQVPPPAEPAPVAEPAPAAVEPAAVAAVPAPAAPEAAAGGSDSYAVQNGDTLMRIAFEKYGDLFAWRKIYEANQSTITDPNVLPVGTSIVIPKLEGRTPASVPAGAEKYQIQSGDTLGSISSKVYGDKSLWKKLWDQNKSWIKNPNKIFAGFFLYYTLSDEDKARVPASSAQ